LVPDFCHTAAGANQKYIELPEYKAVLVFDKEQDEKAVPAVADLLHLAPTISEHNRVLATLEGGYVHIVIADDRRLLLCNSYHASDNITAEYFIFAAIKQFQINPEVTTLFFLGETPMEIRDDLFRYFKGVELI